MPPRPAVDKNCRHTEVEHDVCASAAYGAVWKLDLTMQKLGGRLSDEVIDALKVLTGYGLQTIDFSRYAGWLAGWLSHGIMCGTLGSSRLLGLLTAAPDVGRVVVVVAHNASRLGSLCTSPGLSTCMRSPSVMQQQPVWQHPRAHLGAGQELHHPQPQFQQ